MSSSGLAPLLRILVLTVTLVCRFRELRTSRRDALYRSRISAESRFCYDLHLRLNFLCEQFRTYNIAILAAR